MLSFLSSFPIPVLSILDIEAYRFYDRNHHMYEAALLTRCYTQHALRPFIDSELNHQRHFIKIPFIDKGMDFIDLPSTWPSKAKKRCLFFVLLAFFEYIILFMLISFLGMCQNS